MLVGGDNPGEVAGEGGDTPIRQLILCVQTSATSSLMEIQSQGSVPFNEGQFAWGQIFLEQRAHRQPMFALCEV